MRSINPLRHKHERGLVAVAAVLLSAFILISALWTPSQMPSTCPGVGGKCDFDFISPIDVQLPTPPPANNSTNKTCPAPPPAPKPLRLAAGGDVQLMTTQELDTLKALGITEIHVVVPDAELYKNTLAEIQKRGMIAVYDGEMPFWYNRNSAAPFSSLEVTTLKSIYDAGWRYFSSEGLYAAQVAQINAVGFKYISYGGDMGENLYTMPSFGLHGSTSHYANDMEAYNPTIKTTIFNTILYHAKMTPCNNGILFGLWPIARNNGANLLATGNGDAWIKELNAKGANVTTAVFWCGLGQKPSTWIGNSAIYHTQFDEVAALRF